MGVLRSAVPASTYHITQNDIATFLSTLDTDLTDYFNIRLGTAETSLMPKLGDLRIQDVDDTNNSDFIQFRVDDGGGIVKIMGEPSGIFRFQDAGDITGIGDDSDFFQLTTTDASGLVLLEAKGGVFVYQDSDDADTSNLLQVSVTDALAHVLIEAEPSGIFRFQDYGDGDDSDFFQITTTDAGGLVLLEGEPSGIFRFQDAGDGDDSDFFQMSMTDGTGLVLLETKGGILRFQDSDDGDASNIFQITMTDALAHTLIESEPAGIFRFQDYGDADDSDFLDLTVTDALGHVLLEPKGGILRIQDSDDADTSELLQISVTDALGHALLEEPGGVFRFQDLADADTSDLLQIRVADGQGHALLSEPGGILRIQDLADIADGSDILEFAVVDGGGRVEFRAEPSGAFRFQDLADIGDDSDYLDMDVADGSGTVVLTSAGTIDLQAPDTDDYIRLTTTADIPAITTVGACNLEIFPSGEITNFSPQETRMTGESGVVRNQFDIMGSIFEFGPEELRPHDYRVRIRGTTDDASPNAGTTRFLLEDAEATTNWTESDAPNTGITLIAAERVGAGALRIALTQTASDGDTVRDTTTYTNHDWSAYTRIGFWLRRSTALATVVFQIQDGAAGWQTVKTLVMGNYISGNWYYVEADISGLTLTDVDGYGFSVTSVATTGTMDFDEVEIWDHTATNDQYADLVSGGSFQVFQSGGIFHFQDQADANDSDILQISVVDAGGRVLVEAEPSGAFRFQDLGDGDDSDFLDVDVIDAGGRVTLGAEPSGAFQFRDAAAGGVVFLNLDVDDGGARVVLGAEPSGLFRLRDAGAGGAEWLDIDVTDAAGAGRVVFGAEPSGNFRFQDAGAAGADYLDIEILDTGAAIRFYAEPDGAFRFQDVGDKGDDSDILQITVTDGGGRVGLQAEPSGMFRFQDLADIADDSDFLDIDVTDASSTVVFATPGTVQFRVSGDADDYLLLQTNSNIPGITTGGASDLEIYPSGEITVLSPTETRLSTISGAKRNQLDIAGSIFEFGLELDRPHDYRLRLRGTTDDVSLNGGSARYLMEDGNSIVNWVASDGVNTPIATNASERVGATCLRITLTQTASDGDTVRDTTYTNDNIAGYTRIGFWFRRTTAEGTVVLQIQDGAGGWQTAKTLTLTDYISGDWYYVVADISGLTRTDLDSWGWSVTACTVTGSMDFDWVEIWDPDNDPDQYTDLVCGGSFQVLQSGGIFQFRDQADINNSEILQITATDALGHILLEAEPSGIFRFQDYGDGDDSDYLEIRATDATNAVSLAAEPGTFWFQDAADVDLSDILQISVRDGSGRVEISVEPSGAFRFGDAGGMTTDWLDLDILDGGSRVIFGAEPSGAFRFRDAGAAGADWLDIDVIDAGGRVVFGAEPSGAFRFRDAGAAGADYLDIDVLDGGSIVRFYGEPSGVFRFQDAGDRGDDSDIFQITVTDAGNRVLLGAEPSGYFRFHDIGDGDASDYLDLMLADTDAQIAYLSSATQGDLILITGTGTADGGYDGIHLDLTGSTPNGQAQVGLKVNMNATYDAATQWAAQFTGDGLTTSICGDGLLAIETDGPVKLKKHSSAVGVPPGIGDFPTDTCGWWNDTTNNKIYFVWYGDAGAGAALFKIELT